MKKASVLITPTVSVIIPTYNRKDLLHGALNSLAQQTYPSDHFEAIVIDDGSTDGQRRFQRSLSRLSCAIFGRTIKGMP